MCLLVFLLVELLLSTACDAGMYASAVLEECVVCPNNSNGTVPGLAECPCDEGYYRTPQEIDMPCTREYTDMFALYLVTLKQHSLCTYSSTQGAIHRLRCSS